MAENSSALTFRPVTHGRHCPCSACRREDWTRITAPCGMHGPTCPSEYAPIPPERRAFAVRLARGLVVADRGEALDTREAADALRQRVEDMLSERGVVIEVERV